MMALGAIEAINQSGRAGKIRVLGFDAVKDARAALETGAMAATVAQYPDEMGKAAIEMAVKAVRGETVDPDVGVRIGLVTRENARR
jgi:ribose transport system substrate-binding protein